ncbi:unnamed protein product, partial [marine sediment metagenome]
LVYPYLREVIEKILSLPHTHAVILSNGKTVSHFSSWLNTISKKRVHFQVSVDGNPKIHDTIRGKGAYAELKKNLINLQQIGFPVTLAMCVNRLNLKEMVSLVQIAGQLEVKNIHYLWLFLKGKAKEEKVIKNELIFHELIKAYKLAQEKNIFIDNIEIIKSQIFSLPGTRFDLSNAGWESLAISPEGYIYPSPALIFEKELNAGHISEGIKNVWLKSPVFEKIRKTSLIDNNLEQGDAMRFLIGGGDIDHSYIAGKHFVGFDPYRSPDSLKECWFHLTNRCNMDCEYCMFKNYGIKDKEITKEQIFKAIKETYQLGVRIFYFTGGEPLVYPYLREVIEKILSLPHTHAVILSNGKTVSHFSSWLNTISKKRVHFQVSVDGNPKIHDTIRGKGAYAELKKNLINLQQI